MTTEQANQLQAIYDGRTILGGMTCFVNNYQNRISVNTFGDHGIAVLPSAYYGNITLSAGTYFILHNSATFGSILNGQTITIVSNTSYSYNINISSDDSLTIIKIKSY